MPADVASQQQPTKPKLRLWGTVSGCVSLAVYTIAKSGYELGIWESLAYAALPAIPLVAAWLILNKETKQYEIRLLEWKIVSQKNWIAYHEKALADGQPWFDDDAPDDWTFEHKRSIANSRDRIVELEIELEQLRAQQGPKGVA